MLQYKTLDRMNTGERATISKITSCGSMRRRFLDIGLSENLTIECVGRSPMGDPVAYLIRGAVIAIRKKDSKDVIIRSCKEGE